MKNNPPHGNLGESEEFPENYRELVSRHLRETYGDKISIRSAIIYPPAKGKKVISGREMVSFTGKVRFHVIDRLDKDFGMHQLTYVIQNDRVVSMEEKP